METGVNVVNVEEEEDDNDDDGDDVDDDDDDRIRGRNVVAVERKTAAIFLFPVIVLGGKSEVLAVWNRQRIRCGFFYLIRRHFSNTQGPNSLSPNTKLSSFFSINVNNI